MLACGGRQATLPAGLAPSIALGLSLKPQLYAPASPGTAGRAPAVTSGGIQLSPGLTGKCHWQSFIRLGYSEEDTDADEYKEDSKRKKQSVAWLGWHKKGVAEMLAARDLQRHPIQPPA